MKGINIFHINQLKNWDIDKQTINGKWVPARPFGSVSIFVRLKAALYVLLGKADIVLWDED